MRRSAVSFLVLVCAGSILAQSPSPTAAVAKGSTPQSAQARVAGASAATPASVPTNTPPTSPAAAPAKKPPAKPAPTPTPSAYLRDICSVLPEPAEPPDPPKEEFLCRRIGIGDHPPSKSIPLPKAFLTSSCSGIPSPSFVQTGTAVTTQLGTPPKPFTVQAQGPYIYIYSSSKGTLSAADFQTLADLEKSIATLAAMHGYEFEKEVPHAASLGNNVAAQLQAIAPAGITVTMTGTSRVRVVGDGTTSCDAVGQFLGDFERFVNHTKSSTPVADVFFLDPAATANAVGATAIPFAQAGTSALVPVASSASSTGNPGSPTGSATPAPGGGSGGGTGGGTGGTGGGGGSGGGGNSTASPAGNPTSPSGGSGGGSSAPTVTITTSHTMGAPATKPTSSAAPAAPADTGGSASTATPADTTTTTISTTPSAAPSTPTIGATPVAPAAPAPTQAFSVNGRSLLFTGGSPGDDAWIIEKKRALALLDLPQPQVLVNAWMIQHSTSRGEDAGKLTTLLHEVVNSYNDAIQQSLYLGWSEVVHSSSKPSFFDKAFYNYVTLRTVADPPLDLTKSESADEKSALGPKNGICPLDQYCLGYTTFFHPVHPRLTDLLLTLLAAEHPANETKEAIEAMRSATQVSTSEPCGPGKGGPCGLERKELEKLKTDLWLTGKGWSPCGCQQDDQKELLRQVTQDTRQLRLPLTCFQETMNSADDGQLKGPLSMTGPLVPNVGVVRAALADFLFNYKLSQEFPHEFDPYDLTASAQALDAALAPYIHAFNEDLQAFQTFMSAELIEGASSHSLDRDKNTFINDGLITVQTTSGDVASVDTGTQSYMNVSRAPSISQLLSSITGTPISGASSPLPGLLSNLSANEAQVLVGALQAYQSTSLSVGRQLNLVVKPRSLLGAEAAEMDVQFNADQSPTAPTYWTPGPNGGAGKAADLSAVTQHDVTTHVRIDSIRLFDISSLTAVLSKGRDKFPLLPPFVEIPYIGTLAGIPLKAAREYHSSSAVISAMIVPTATDIAYSLRFSNDRVVRQTPACTWKPGTMPISCEAHKAASLKDFGQEPIKEFHRLMLHCISTVGGTGFPIGITDEELVVDQFQAQDTCSKLSFSHVLRDDDN